MFCRQYYFSIDFHCQMPRCFSYDVSVKSLSSLGMNGSIKWYHHLIKELNLYKKDKFKDSASFITLILENSTSRGTLRNWFFE